MRRKIAILAVVASTLLLVGLPAGQALAAEDDDIPGPPTGAGVISGVVEQHTDMYDVYCVKLFDGEEVRLTLAQTPPTTGFSDSYYVYLATPDSTSVSDYYSVLGVAGSQYREITKAYTPAKDGIYYIIVQAADNDTSAPYTITISGSAEKPPTQSYLRLRTSSTKASKGHSVRLSAKLVDVASTLIPNYSVNLFRSNDGRAWTKMTTLSSTTGEYAKKVRIIRKTWFKMRFSGDATWSMCASRAVTVSLR